jgi:hypothetical protein
MAWSGHSSSVGAEINDVRLNHSINPLPPAATIGPSCQRRSRPASSVASSRTRDMRTAQNEAARTARLAHDLIDEEEQEQEVAATMEAAKMAADNMIAAKAKSKGARARREFERKRFEINATLSETLAQIEDDYINDQRSSHGLDTEIVGSGDSEMSPQSIYAYASGRRASFVRPNRCAHE